MPMGIVSQLPSSHLSIHRVPAKLSNRVLPYGDNSCRLRLLFVVGSLLTGLLQAVLINQWTHLRLVLPCQLVLMPYFPRHRLRVPSPGPCPTSCHQEVRQDPGGYGCLYADDTVNYAACAAAFSGCLISLSILIGSYLWPVRRIAKMTLRILHAITISDCIFFSGLSGRVV